MFMRLLGAFLLIFAAIAISAEDLPKPAREFRAVWIATVANIDFPSKPALNAIEQQAEIVRMLDLARELKLNAVIFQVRPMADALYDSPLEPWSEFLTGEMGKSQAFDPLEFVVQEAHRRGILVHAGLTRIGLRTRRRKLSQAITSRNAVPIWSKIRQISVARPRRSGRSRIFNECYRRCRAALRHRRRSFRRLFLPVSRK
jgi:uncharacterized lipoprotein YddW (UPF0748 family)